MKKMILLCIIVVICGVAALVIPITVVKVVLFVSAAFGTYLAYQEAHTDGVNRIRRL